MPIPDLATLRVRLAADGPTPSFLSALDAALAARRDQRGDHAAWAALCEEAGAVAAAFREFQLALRDHPDDPIACARLAHHYRERGDLERAAQMLERLLARDPARDEWLTEYVELLREADSAPRLLAALDRARRAGLPPARAEALVAAIEGAAAESAPPDLPPAPTPAGFPTEADCARFLALFSGREDVHARQWARPGGDGGYSPVREPLTPAVARNHLLGSYTVGVYPIRLDATATFFALDLDIDRAALERAQGDPALARRLRDQVRSAGLRLRAEVGDLGLQPLFEDSGYKGRHLWVFLEQPETAEVLHFFGRRILAWQAGRLPDGLHLEYFPKQASLKGKGLGNLIKLPLGVHRRTGRRSLLLDEQGRPVTDPFAALRNVSRCGRETLYAAIERLKALAPADPSPAESLPSIAPARSVPAAKPPAGPLPPPRPPVWTEADFESDPRIRHLLSHCPVLASLKRAAEEHRRLTQEEQLVLIHTMGHVEAGPLAVNYLLARCVDVAPERFLKDRLKGNPVSCPSIRKKIPHVTRRVACDCPFEFARDRYPTPTLHLLTLPAESALPAPPAIRADAEGLAVRYGASLRRLREIQRETDETRAALSAALRALPDRVVACPGGRYRMIEKEGVEELVWEAECAATPGPAPSSAAGPAAAADPSSETSATSSSAPF